MLGRRSGRRDVLLGLCCLALIITWAAKNGVFEGFNPLTRPRQERERISCLGNLRALSLAMMQYQDDYSTRFPPAPSRTASALRTATAPYGWADTLLPYFKDTTKLRCPSDDTPRGSSPTQSGYTSYWINSNLYGQAGSGAYTLFGEGGDGHDITDARYSKASLPSWVDEATGPAVRHVEGTTRKACYLWMSGITKSLTPKDARVSFGPTFKVR